MGTYADEFRRAYGQGRQDTRKQIDSVREGGEISHDYSHRIACQTMLIAFLCAVLAGGYVWQVNHASFFTAVVVALVTWCATLLFTAIFYALYFGLQARLSDSSRSKRKGLEQNRTASPQTPRESTQEVLSDLEQQYLFRCLAIVGSGTYALKGREQEQVAVLRSALRHAKENGCDWKRIYSAVISFFATIGRYSRVLKKWKSNSINSYFREDLSRSSSYC